jgi:hypothetical protein
VSRVAGQASFASRRVDVDRRGWTYLGGTLLAALGASFIASILAYVVLAGAAIGAWVTRQHAVVRWTLTLLAVALVAALVLGFSVGTTGHGSRGGPITPGG